MMKIFYRIIADIIWILHLFVVIVVLFGWLVPSIWYLYISVLVLTLLSEIFWSYCLLSKWEFNLRKKIIPSLDYEYVYASYYMYKLTQGWLSRDFLNRWGMVFTVLSLSLNIYFHFIY